MIVEAIDYPKLGPFLGGWGDHDDGIVCEKCGVKGDWGPWIRSDIYRLRVPKEYQKLRMCRQCMLRWFTEEDFTIFDKFREVYNSGFVREDNLIEFTVEQIKKIKWLAGLQNDSQ